MTTTRSKKTAITLALGTGLLLCAGLAAAGHVNNQDVKIWTDDVTGNRAAKGVLRAARNSPDARQSIGCLLYSWDSGGSQILCRATDAAGNHVGCSATQEAMQRVAGALGPASYIYFQVNPDGSCDRVLVENNSSGL